MTIIVKVKNEGPHDGKIMFYGADRKFKNNEEKILKVGEETTLTVHDGNIPVICSDAKADANGDTFSTVPPCGGG